MRLCSTSCVGIVDAVVESSLALKHTPLLRTPAKFPYSSLVVFLLLNENIFKRKLEENDLILWPICPGVQL